MQNRERRSGYLTSLRSLAVLLPVYAVVVSWTLLDYITPEIEKRQKDLNCFVRGRAFEPSALIT